jgi:hypothetical protein
MSQQTSVIPTTAPITRRVRAYFAPSQTLFDAAQSGRFALDAVPAPWIDLGWCTKFARKSGTKIAALRTGAPATTTSQARTEIEATVHLEFESWGKLQMALSCGSQQMNMLATAASSAANGSGGLAATPVPLTPSSTATALNVGAASSSFAVGDLVAVDVDYTGQTGYVGSGASAAYVRSAANVANDVNYIRRITLNVARVVAIANGTLTLAAPLLAGPPTAGMQVSRLLGFVDREGGSFFQEWSALFVIDGEQGDRVLFHYPRLQVMQTAAESADVLESAAQRASAQLQRLRLNGAFRALPVRDPNDGETVLCFRSYLPAAMTTV